MMSNDAGCEGLVPDPAYRHPDTSAEQEGYAPDESAGHWHGEPVRIRIDGLPADLPAGEYRMRFSGYAEHPGDGTAVLRFRYVNMADEMSPADQQRLGAAMARTRALAEGYGGDPDLYLATPHGTTEVINVSKIARVITALLEKGVLEPGEIALALRLTDVGTPLAEQVEGWLRS